jgi:hypothetical protein
VPFVRENLLVSFETKVLLKIFGPLLENGFRRRRKNSEICKLCDEYDVEFIKIGRLGWAGHMMRMEESDPAMIVLCTKPGRSGDRRRERPKLRFCDESEEDILRLGTEIGVNAHLRGELLKPTEEVKSHRGL